MTKYNDDMDYRRWFYGLLTMNPPEITESLIAYYGSEDGFKHFVEHAVIPSAEDARMHYAAYVISQYNKQYQ